MLANLVMLAFMSAATSCSATIQGTISADRANPSLPGRHQCLNTLLPPSEGGHQYQDTIDNL